MQNPNLSRGKALPRSEGPRGGKRFELQRERILIAATDLINEHGTKGTTLLDVAAAVGLNTTSATYYFRRKEMLAAAVIERTLERLEAIVRDAARMPTPQERVASFTVANVALREQVLRGTGLPLAKLSDVRTLDDVYRKPLVEQYKAIFRQIRDYFGPPKSDLHKALLTVRAHVLSEVSFWLPIWTAQYQLSDFPRVKSRLVDLLANGFGAPDVEWFPTALITDDTQFDESAGPQSFLKVATRLINDAGYRGASVDRIAEELKVTKGSFDQHLDAKDDLVLACFRHSFRRYSGIISSAERSEQQGGRRFAQIVATLLDIQFYSDWPLVRTTAFQALPTDLRIDMIARTNRGALRLAGNLVDGMQDGSIRVVDQFIASQLVFATVNAAYDVRSWASRLPRDTAIALYASALFDGMFNDRIIDRIEGRSSARAG